MWVYNELEMKKVMEWLQGAKQCLDSDSEIKIDAAKASIDIAMRNLERDHGE